MHQVNQQALQQQHQSDVVLNARRLDGDVQKKPEVIKKEVYKLPEGVTLWGDGQASFVKPEFFVSDRDADMFFSGTSMGFPAGKYVGFQKGSDEGLKLGNKQGYQLGDAHGYIKGFDAGHNDGFHYGAAKYGMFGSGATATVGGSAWSIAKAIKLFGQTSAAAASEGPAAATIGAATGVEAAAAGGLLAESAVALSASALVPFALPAIVTGTGVGLLIGALLQHPNTHSVHGV